MTAKLKTIRLPSKLSKLILVALDDLTRVERSKKYRVNMDNWHVPNGQCAVCLAGAVMTRKLAPTEVVWLYEGVTSVFDGGTVRKFTALDKARQGHVRSALKYLGVSADRVEETGVDACNADIVDFPTYAEDRRAWKRGMRKLSKWLDARGL